MNLHINDKFPLIDLTVKGSAARRYVKPNVLISDPEGGVFAKGDILDANATFRLIRDMVYGEDKTSVGYYSTKTEFEQALNQDKIEPNAVYFIDNPTQIYLNGKYMIIEGLTDYDKEYIQGLITQSQNSLVEDIRSLQSQVDELKNRPKELIITESQYAALDKYERDAIYFIVEKLSTDGWTFGDKFPIVFGGGDEWKFGDQFPIILN